MLKLCFKKSVLYIYIYIISFCKILSKCSDKNKESKNSENKKNYCCNKNNKINNNEEYKTDDDSNIENKKDNLDDPTLKKNDKDNKDKEEDVKKNYETKITELLNKLEELKRNNVFLSKIKYNINIDPDLEQKISKINSDELLTNCQNEINFLENNLNAKLNEFKNLKTQDINEINLKYSNLCSYFKENTNNEIKEKYKDVFNVEVKINIDILNNIKFEDVENDENIVNNEKTKLDNIILKIREKLNESLNEINKLEIDKDTKDTIKNINENYIKNANVTELINIDQKFNNLINQVKLSTDEYRKQTSDELINIDFDLLSYFKINKDKSQIEQSINKATNNKDLGKINDEINTIKTKLINSKNSKITEINNKIKEINEKIDIIGKITIFEIKEKFDKILIDTTNLSNNNSKKGDFEEIENKIKEKEEKLNTKLTEIKSEFENINKNIIEKNTIIGSTITNITIDNSFNYNKILDIQTKINNNSKYIDDKINNKINEINNKKKEINKKIDIIDKITIIEIKEKIDKISDINTLNINSKKKDFDKIEEEIKAKEGKLNNKLTKIKSEFENINKDIIKKNAIIGSTITDIKIDDNFSYDKILDIQENFENNSKSIDAKIEELNLNYKSQLNEFNKYITLFNEFYTNFNYELLKNFIKEYKDLNIKNSPDTLKDDKKFNDEKLKELKKNFEELKEGFINNYYDEIDELNKFFKLHSKELEEFDENSFNENYVKERIEYISNKQKEKDQTIEDILNHNEKDNFEKYLKTALENFKDIKEIKYEDVEFKDIDKVQNNIINPVSEGNRIYIQSDIEGKYEILLSLLKTADIINIKNKKDVYYNFLTGKFEDKAPENNLCIKLNLFEVNKDFKGTYINIGDIVDRCAGNNNCLKTLLLILYIKQELGDKIKLICGNHEIGWYCNDKNPECNCCKDIKDLTTLICYKAISLGQIKFFDNIEIGSKKYVLSHKIIYHNNDETADFHKILKYIDRSKYKNITTFDDYIDKDGHFLTDKGFEILDKFNDKFKKNFTDFISKINTYTHNQKLLRYFIFKYDNKLNYKKMVVYKHRYKEKKLNDKVKNIIKNSINGHDHHEYKECYNKDINILIADNWSYIDIDLTNYRSNIHFIDKTKNIIKDKIIEITKDKTEIYDLEQNKYIKY